MEEPIQEPYEKMIDCLNGQEHRWKFVTPHVSICFQCRVGKIDNFGYKYIQADTRPRKKIRTDVTPETFVKSLVKHHIQQSTNAGGMLGYSALGKVRKDVKTELRLSYQGFNDWLIIVAEKYRPNIRFHGGPTHAYGFMPSIEIKGKLYLLMSMLDEFVAKYK